jgi:hypothetical protein
MKSSLENFMDDNGRVKQWPAKFSVQELVLQYLCTKFENNKVYAENEINSVLKQWHTFGDWAILRRALVDSDYLKRNRDGTEYRRVR